MNLITKTIIEKATLKKALFFSALFIFFLLLINFSGIGVAGLLAITGGAGILDFEFGFTYAQANEMLTALGADGRAFYLTRIIPLDFPFPIAYMLCYLGWIALLIKQSEPKQWHKYLLLTPVLAMLFDWIENFGIIVMLNSYPNLPTWAVSLASISGVLKFTFMFVSIAIIVVLQFSTRKHKQKAK